MVVDWEVETAVIEILNVTEVAPDGIVMEDGTATAELLLDRLTITPAPVAGAARETEQLSDEAPTTAVLVHWMLCSDGVVPPPGSVLPFLTVTVPQPETRKMPSRRAGIVHTAKPEVLARPAQELNREGRE
jgi:hypothetical protein